MTELKSDNSVVKVENIGPEESTVIYKTIFIQEESVRLSKRSKQSLLHLDDSNSYLLGANKW